MKVDKTRNHLTVCYIRFTLHKINDSNFHCPIKTGPGHLINTKYYHWTLGPRVRVEIFESLTYYSSETPFPSTISLRVLNNKVVFR